MRRQILVILTLCLLGTFVLAVENDERFASAKVSQARVYLPGDVVHLVVGAPVDVSEMTAILPNNDKLELQFDRRTRTWHGHWEIPYNFPKGDYRARLIATDVEGKVFEGESASFYIGEPALVTLIGVDLKKKIDLPREEATEPKRVAAPARETVRPVVKPTPKPKAKPKPKPVQKSLPPAPKKAEAPVVNAGKLQLERTRLITEARYYFKQQDYVQGRARLAELLKLDPDSREIKEIINRIDEVIKSKESEK